MAPVQAERIKVFLVDDHPIVREGLSQLIDRESDLRVCGQAEDARSTLEQLESAQPDIVIVDVSLNGPDGIDLLKEIRSRYPRMAVLILSMHDELLYAERSLRAGANGYVMKQEATEVVLTAIRRILNGDIYVSERMANKMVLQFVNGTGPPRQSSIEDLTNRELEVFRLVGQGLSTRQIAEQLHLSVKTVETHYAHIKDKLSLKNARALVQYAIECARR